MDVGRFDRLARALAAPANRRATVAALVSAGLAGAIPARSEAKPEPAKCRPVGKRCSQAAAPTRGNGNAHKGKKSKHHPPSCGKCCSRFGSAGPDGKARCTCKGEGVACDNDSQCCGGQCRNDACTGCPGDTVFCADGCADLQTNNLHCGACDTPCDAGQRCVDGACVCDAQSCLTGCCDGTDCKRGTADGACGVGGERCKICAASQRCDGTNCVCDPTRGCCANADCDDDQICLTDGTCAPACTTVDNFCGLAQTCLCKPVLNGSGNACLSFNVCSCAADCATCGTGSICVVNDFLRDLCPEDQPLFCCAPCPFS